jgi:hypothetical protein
MLAFCKQIICQRPDLMDIIGQLGVLKFKVSTKRTIIYLMGNNSTSYVRSKL